MKDHSYHKYTLQYFILLKIFWEVQSVIHVWNILQNNFYSILSQLYDSQTSGYYAISVL